MLLEKWSQSTPFSRIATMTVFILIGAIAVYNWMVKPHVNYLMAAQKYHNVTTDLNKKNKKLITDVTSLTQKLENIQSQFNSLHSKLISESDAKNFFDNIQNVADQAKCSVLSLNFLTTDTDQDTTQSVIRKRARLVIAGSYKDIVSLIDEFQTDTSQICLDSVNISSISDSDMLKCNMTITAYVIAEKEIEVK